MLIETTMNRDSLNNLSSLKGHRFQFLFEMNSRNLDDIDSVHIATDGPSIQIVSDDDNQLDAGYFEVKPADPTHSLKCFEAGWVFLKKRHQLVKNVRVVRTSYKNRSDSRGNGFDHICERGILLELEAGYIYFHLSQPFSFLFSVKYLNSLDELEVQSRHEAFDGEPDIDFDYQLVAIDDLIGENDV